MKEMLSNWKIAQDAGAVLPCPRCGLMRMKSRTYENALSRRADIYVCSSCGHDEAMEDMGHSYHSPSLEVGSEEYNEHSLKKWWLANTVLNEPSLQRNATGAFKISVEREIMLTEEDIDDIMAAALEGGINYWCCKAEVVGEYLGEYGSEQISRGGELILHDAEEDARYELTLEKFLKGFVLACKGGFASDWFDDEGNVDTCMIDADGADVIVQYGVFGELVYG